MDFENQEDVPAAQEAGVEDAVSEADAQVVVPAEAETAEETAETSGPLDAFLDELFEDGQDRSVMVAEQPADTSVGTVSDDMSVAAESQGAVDEASLLSEIHSERGRNRIRSMMKGHRELQARCDELTAVNEGVAKMIQDTGMAPEELAKTLEFCRLAYGEDAAGLEVALGLLERERDALYLKLGKDAPGSDPLAGFDDLKQAVAGKSLSPQWASEVARFRRLKSQRDAEMQRTRLSEQKRQAYVDRVQVFQREALSLFAELRKQDPDYPMREQAVMVYLAKPGVMQGMVNRLSPDQFLYHLKAVYDTAPVGRLRPAGGGKHRFPVLRCGCQNRRFPAVPAVRSWGVS